ncbi:unnamed protein product [Mytilus coruscus]|uniref:Fucosyltransferase n=1 Tax=Mytilus coruscus TaxID=42192 RepID=A0A6J8EBF1_MYTCO|nr:unnamed protein product [Mytilus coruscus]
MHFSRSAKNVCIGVVVFLISIWFLWTLKRIKNFEIGDMKIAHKQPQTTWSNTSNFTILFYAYPSYFNAKYIVFDKCKYTNCKVTTDKKVFTKSDAVIFHHNEMSTSPNKLNGQIWIFASLESPYNTYKTFRNDAFKMKFDWTMTYRKDSEVFAPYGFVRKQLYIPKKNYTSIFLNKTRNIAWVVSHCQTISKRELYVKELSKYIDVDIYGACGKPCSSTSAEECKKLLSKTYKFYLSFENSLCKDYLTEKITTMYMHNMSFIPIVRGAPNPGDHLPQNTYISTSDFKSPQNLAAFLKKIGTNETRYISYLKEKNKYLFHTDPNFQSGMCDICYHLNVRQQKPKTKNLTKWLWENQCQEPKDIPS